LRCLIRCGEIQPILFSAIDILETNSFESRVSTIDSYLAIHLPLISIKKPSTINEGQQSFIKLELEAYQFDFEFDSLYRKTPAEVLPRECFGFAEVVLGCWLTGVISLFILSWFVFFYFLI